MASFTGGAEAVTKMREIAQGAEEWVVIVDLDEFVEFPEPVTALVEKVEAEGANIARGVMYDRFAMDGQLKDFADDSDLSALFPVRARFRRLVMGGNEIKGVLVKGDLKSFAAHHKFYDERPYSETLEISHYKWNDRALDRTRLRATCVRRPTARGILKASLRGSSTTMNCTGGSPGRRLAAKLSAATRRRTARSRRNDEATAPRQLQIVALPSGSRRHKSMLYVFCQPGIEPAPGGRKQEDQEFPFPYRNPLKSADLDE